MKKFNEIFRHTPALPRDEQVINFCKMYPYRVPVSVIIGQYKSAPNNSEDKALLRDILIRLTSENTICRLEEQNGSV